MGNLDANIFLKEQKKKGGGGKTPEAKDKTAVEKTKEGADKKDDSKDKKDPKVLFLTESLKNNSQNF